MEEIDLKTINYKEKAIELLRANFQYVVIGSFVMSFLLVYGFTKIAERFSTGKNSQVKNVTEKEIAQAPAVQNLQEKVLSKEINYITPQPSSGGTTLVAPETAKEEGQISAIATEQVTYKQNKYIVQLGDSLASIALQTYGDSNAWVKLAEANNLPSPDAIEVGMELIVPR